jgi:sulfur-oxidizing protein SoxA
MIFSWGNAVVLLASLLAVSANAQTTSTPDLRRSGFEFMGRSTQAMQKDDTLNPGMLSVKDGEALWLKAAGRGNKTCATCHGSASDSMKGVAARYPSFDDVLKRPVGLSQRINQCRVQYQQTTPLRAESTELLALESFVAMQSRGLPIAPPADPRLEPFRQAGEQRFLQRMGQLNLSCAQCHDANSGSKLGSAIIPQAHPMGYPVYRLEWQAVGSLQRRLRNCMNGVRAEPFAYGAPELIELELYLNARAKGMLGETPAVRP